MYRLPLSDKIGDLAEKDFATLDENTLVGVAAKIMRDKDVSCVLVTRKDSSSNDPIGIVAERDMLYRVLAENKGPFKVNLGRIMSSPLITIDANSSVADAILIMRNERWKNYWNSHSYVYSWKYSKPNYRISRSPIT